MIRASGAIRPVAVCGSPRTCTALAMSVVALWLASFGAPAARAAAFVPNKVVVGYALATPGVCGPCAVGLKPEPSHRSHRD